MVWTENLGNLVGPWLDDIVDSWAWTRRIGGNDGSTWGVARDIISTPMCVGSKRVPPRSTPRYACGS
jgi:hypothetical protein